MKKLICLGAILLTAASIGSADILFVPQNSAINVGDPITVSVVFAGAVSSWVGGYDIDIAYDPAILSFSLVTWPNNYLDISLQNHALGVGTVNVAEVSLASVADLGAAQSGHDPLGLFDLVFTGVAPGVSPLTFTRVDLTDGLGNAFAAGNMPGGSVTVGGSQAIPEPSSFLLLLVAAGSTVAGLRRRRG